MGGSRARARPGCGGRPLGGRQALAASPTNTLACALPSSNFPEQQQVVDESTGGSSPAPTCPPGIFRAAPSPPLASHHLDSAGTQEDKERTGGRELAQLPGAVDSKKQAGTRRERIQTAGTRTCILRPYAPPARWIRLLGLHLHSVPQLYLCKAAEILRFEFITIAPSCQHGLSSDFGTFQRQGASNSHSKTYVLCITCPLSNFDVLIHTL